MPPRRCDLTRVLTRNKRSFSNSVVLIAKSRRRIFCDGVASKLRGAHNNSKEVNYLGQSRKRSSRPVARPAKAGRPWRSARPPPAGKLRRQSSSRHTRTALRAHLIDAFLSVAASPNPTPAVVRADGAVDHKAHVVCVIPPLAPSTPKARKPWRHWTRSW